MAKKLMAWKTKGMNQDLSVSAFNPEFSFENMNLRLSTNEGNTQLSWVNEKGTKQLTITLSYWKKEGQSNVTGGYTDAVAQELPNSGTEYANIADAEADGWSWVDTALYGTPIGTATINHQLILFTTSNTLETNVTSGNHDHIYLFNYQENSEINLNEVPLFTGNLNFSTLHPLETLVSYESETVQKVYWTDGRNQPRMINIAADEDTIENWKDTSFDFIPTLKLEEEVKILKEFGGTGMFPPGVIQYAFTYYNKYGAESNIFYTSPLLYVSYSDRGASPEDKVANSFKITVDHVDTDFDYLRIYSIQRTSVNGTPIVKRVQDILTSDNNSGTITYIDTGLNGDTVDPTELLYKGGETITAQTMEQKDGTLFFGNIEQKRGDIVNSLRLDIAENTSITTGFREFVPLLVSEGAYKYYSQLTSVSRSGGVTLENTVPCSGFKRGNRYRLGLQFQHKTGKWSEPIYVTDEDEDIYPYFSQNSDLSLSMKVPIFQGILPKRFVSQLDTLGYKKVRPLVVFPTVSDRTVLCQGIAAPTLEEYVNTNNIHKYQSSWFFRPNSSSSPVDRITNVDEVIPGRQLRYQSNTIEFNSSAYWPQYLPAVEIQGDYDAEPPYSVNTNWVTLHSPDIEFDTQLQVYDYYYTNCAKVGDAVITNTLSDINIQTSSATIGNGGNGFIHKTFANNSAFGLVSGLFYEDAVVDDKDDLTTIEPDNRDKYYKWMVYLWNKSGSLNNDINRPPSTSGSPTAILRKKVISNLRYTTTTYSNNVADALLGAYPQLFQSDDITILKWSDAYYRGNIDTMVVPKRADGMYCYGPYRPLVNSGTQELPDWSISSNWASDKKWQKTYSKSSDEAQDYGLYYFPYNNNLDPDPRFLPTKNYYWIFWEQDVGNIYVDLVMKKEGVRIKYKSTPHIVLKLSNGLASEQLNGFSVLELRQPISTSTIYGGTSMDALKANHWIPCGEPVSLGDGSTNVTFEYSYGDTYYQRYDCLKTYPFTREDENQVVEIGSFMLETYTNIDGRYDRNRGQINNLNMSPINFNLINPVYSQVDNFFTYRITDDYNDTADDIKKYPNQITWSKTKEAGADVDMWTNVTLASILELDGDKGEITSLNRLNDQIFAFQDTGISQVLYNENVQISSTAGVPIEIANSGKVQGKRYITNTVGCSNKWSITTTPGGLYFMDSYHKDIYLFNGQLANISEKMGFNTWAKSHIPAPDVKWNPVDFDNFISHYDPRNQEVLFINEDVALAFSEKFGTFTSFYDYGHVPYFCQLNDIGIWIQNNTNGTSLHQHQAGSYSKFFGVNKPYWMTLVGNPEPQTDKVFTNLEFRASVVGEGSTTAGTYNPFLPFDSLEVWDEYQHGFTSLENKHGHDLYRHDVSNSSSVQRKFRMWRCDIPRDNVPATNSQPASGTAYTRDADLGITRFGTYKPNNRMRNPWLYLKLLKNKEADDTKALPKTEVHDLLMTYYN